MESIKEEIEALILEVILFGQNTDEIEGPKDILEKLRYDAIEEIKDRLWDLIKYELDYDSIFDEIEKRREEETQENEEEESDSE